MRADRSRQITERLPADTLRVSENAAHNQVALERRGKPLKIGPIELSRDYKPTTEEHMLNKVICALVGHRMIVRWKGYQLTCPACLRCDKANPNWAI